MTCLRRYGAIPWYNCVTWEIAAMSKQESVDRSDDTAKETFESRRHPTTMSNSREETLKRMHSFPERAAKFREKLRALREANSR
jgi:hypothetical protein